ncbi:hypothetical protein ACVWWQ_001088 [Rhodanobacter sp. TND4EL1]
MWSDVAIGLLLLLALGQSAFLFHLWRESVLLRGRLDRASAIPAHAITDVPTSMLVTALGRVERQLRLMEQQAPPTRQAYELAQRMAREGADLDQLVSRCGLSRDEARLVMQMHPVNA